MSSFEPGFDFAAANAELLAKASLRAPHRPLGSAAETAMPATWCFRESGPLVWLKVLLIRHDNLLLATHSQIIQTSMVRWPQMSAMGH